MQPAVVVLLESRKPLHKPNRLPTLQIVNFHDLLHVLVCNTHDVGNLGMFEFCPKTSSICNGSSISPLKFPSQYLSHT